MTVLAKYLIARILEDQEMLDKLQDKILTCYDENGKIFYVEKKEQND